MNEYITRKFLVKLLPDLTNIKKENYERYYLFLNESTVIRVQAINNIFEIERKNNKSDLIREEQIIQITKEEFNELKKFSKYRIERESYEIQDNPKINLRVYRGDYEGLNRAEVTFSDESGANNFSPLEWFDKEITNSPLAQEGKLLQLSKEEFWQLLEK